MEYENMSIDPDASDRVLAASGVGDLRDGCFVHPRRIYLNRKNCLKKQYDFFHEEY